MTSFTVDVGLSRRLSATVLSTTGGTLTGRAISWSSGDQSIAGVSAAGVVTGVSVGSTTSPPEARDRWRRPR